MATMDVMKQRNMESSLLFMQQEHATTLKGLHSEIQKLQHRCSELTFQLALEQTSAPSQPGEYKEKCESLQQELSKTKQHLGAQEELVLKKDRRIENLEHQIKALDRKYKDELRHKQMSITKLESELQERCNELASLRMTVLTARTPHDRINISHDRTGDDKKSHGKAHRKSSHDHSNFVSRVYTPDPLLESRESSFSSRDSQEDIESSPFNRHVPIPPLATAASMSKKNSRERKNSASKILTEVRNRPASGRRLVSDSVLLSDSFHDSSVAGDNTDILKIVAQQKETLDLRHGKEMVLPPISNKEPPKRISPRSANSASFSKRIRPVKDKPREKSASPEVEILAVDQVINTDLRKAQEFNSYGTDT